MDTGVQATMVPIREWFAIFNSVLYRDAGAVPAAYPTLYQAFEESGVKAWTVWVPPGDSATATFLEECGHSVGGSPMRMAADIAEIDLRQRMELDLETEPTWEMVARCNDRAHDVLDEWSMVAAFERMDDAASHLYVAQQDGSVVAALIARHLDGDCYFWFVATDPVVQRQGFAGELMRVALRDARARGCETTSLESTAAGEALYLGLGYRPLGRFARWDRMAGYA
jgi:ribosomal protein S18 acetylase RimI-like enzyme